MHRRYFTRLGVSGVATTAIVCIASSAVAQSSTMIVAPNGPPPPRLETMPAPSPTTTPAMTWQAGHWAWNGVNWAWVDGQYVQRPRTTAQWELGHWSLQASGGYVWIDGHWRS